MASSLFTLNVGGAVLAVLFGVAVFCFGLSLWWFFLSVLVDFLVLSSIATKAGSEGKESIRGYEKVRGWKNVVANGAVPVAIVLLYFLDSAYALVPADLLVFAFIASVCSITADKFASEFGVLAGNPVGIFDFKRKRKGVSGAITVFGTVMGAVAAFIVGFTYFSIGSSVAVFAIIVAAGVVGNFMDSVFGHFEENGTGNKYTSNIMCSVAGAVFCIAAVSLLL